MPIEIYPQPSVRTYKKSSSVSTILGDEETLLHDAGNNRYFSINETGAYLWSVLAGRRTAAELEIALIERYGLPADEAEQYVGSFLDELYAHGLVERR